MKILFFFLTCCLNIFSQAQELQNGMSFYLYHSQPYIDGIIEVDSSYHMKYVNNKFEILNKDSSLIFQQRFDDFPVYAGNDYFKAHGGDKVWIFNPAQKIIREINPKLKPLYQFNDLAIALTSLSKDTLIKLSLDLYLNRKDEIIFNGGWYSEMMTKNKKYILQTETDAFFEDLGYFDQIPVEDYDEGIKAQILMRDFKNNFLKNETFDEYENSYESYLSKNTEYSERYVLVKKNKKYGILTTLGKYILEPKYDLIEIIEDEYLFDRGQFFTIKAYIGKTCYVYDTQGKGLFKNDYLPVDSYPYASDLGGNHRFFGHEIKDGKKRGLIHQSGELIIPPLYSEYDFFDFTGKETIFTPKNLNETAKSCEYYPFQQYFMGMNPKLKERDFYAPNGIFLAKYKMDYINEYNKFGAVSYELEGKYGLLGFGACEILKPNYEYIEIFRGNKNIFIVVTEEETYFVDATGKKLFGEFFYSASFSDTLNAIVLSKENYGLMDIIKSDKSIVWTLKPEFDKLEALQFGSYDNFSNYIFSKNGKYGIVNVNSNVMVPNEYDKIYVKDNLIYTVKTKKYGLMNQQFEPLLENNYDSIYPITSSNFLIKKDHKLAIYDASKKQVKTAFDFEDVQQKDSYYSYFTVKKNGKWGVLNDKYEWFIEAKYLNVTYDYVSKEYECLKENGQKDCFFVK